MKLFIDMLAGLLALLAGAALSQFGVDLNRVTAPAEVQRLPDCDTDTATKPTSAASLR